MEGYPTIAFSIYHADFFECRCYKMEVILLCHVSFTVRTFFSEAECTYHGDIGEGYDVPVGNGNARIVIVRGWATQIGYIMRMFEIPDGKFVTLATNKTY